MSVARSQIKFPFLASFFFMFLFAFAIFPKITMAQFTFPYQLNTARTAFVQRSFDHFDADQTGEDVVNSYLLSHLSFGIYTSGQNETLFRQELEDIYNPMGLAVDYVFMNSFTGTEGAVLSNHNAVFLVFRGTSTDGTPYYSWLADHIGDMDDDFRRVTLNYKSFYVHRGFWHNVDSEYSGIRNVVATLAAQGRKVWVTGHSLGGANATLAALRLHYENDITVQGVHTFGAPKVGDSNMVSKFSDYNKDGIPLAGRVTRWIVYGDPAPTFFDKELYWNGRFWSWKFYQHVGKCNTIFPQGNGTFNIYYNTSGANWWNSILNLFDEHSWYDHALEDELLEEGYGHVINKY